MSLSRTFAHKERLFLSWSGDRARDLATDFKEFLEKTLDVACFFSGDIPKGDNWFTELQESLASCIAAVVLVTPESTTSQWQSYEVGAMAVVPALQRKHVDRGHRQRKICTVLVGVARDETPAPLCYFQDTVFGDAIDKPDAEVDQANSKPLLDLAKSLNQEKPHPLPDEDVKLRARNNQPPLLEAIRTALRFHPPTLVSPAALYQDPLPEAEAATLSEQLDNLFRAIDAPAYFLDGHHRIHQANPAAHLLFGLTIANTPQPLRALIEANRDRLPEYKKVIDHLERVTPPDMLAPWDFEPIRFIHDEYGETKLQKIAIALRNERGRHAGWVVAFNIASMANIGAYYGALQHLLEDWIQRRNPPTQTDARRLAYAGYVFDVPMDRAAKEICRDFSYKCMLCPEHGLQSLKAVRDRFDDVDSFIYVRAFREGSSNLLGVARLQTPCDVSTFTNLSAPKMAVFPGGHELADAGAYTLIEPPSRFFIFEGLFISAIRYALASGVHALYVQVPFQQQGLYKRLGFEPCGSSFSVPGWLHVWVPMLMDICDVGRNFADPKFQDLWLQRTGQRLSQAFWRRVFPYIEYFLQLYSCDGMPLNDHAVGMTS